MKKVKIVAMFLTIALILSSFGGCDQIKLLFGTENIPSNSEQNDDKSESPPIYTVPPSPSHEVFWYSIIPDAESYAYGEEISISVSIQLVRDCCQVYPISTSNADVRIILEDSPYYEIIGDNTVCHENIAISNYLSDNEEGNYLITNFKIRVSEPTYVVNEVKLSAELTFMDENGKQLQSKDNFTFEPLRYITDSQGVIIYSMEYSFNYWYFTLKERPYFISKDKLFEKSFTREYNRGVTMEELINRYNKDQLGIGAWFYAYRNYETESYEMTYISENVRLKIYFPVEQEYRELYGKYFDSKFERFDFPKTLLDLALSHGAITEEEYAIEIQRLESDDFPSRNYFQCGQYFECEGFSFPEDDSYFNCIIDIRKESGKS